MVEIPREFKHFTRCFLQDSISEGDSDREWIAGALELIDAQQRSVVKRFLTELLSGNADGNELQHVWASGSPNYVIPDNEELRLFLTIIRDMIK
jgi:hypothetical protein